MCGYQLVNTVHKHLILSTRKENIFRIFLNAKHVLKYIHKQLALRDEELGSGECAETLIRCDEEQNTKPEKKIVTFRLNPLKKKKKIK